MVVGFPSPGTFPALDASCYTGPSLPLRVLIVWSLSTYGFSCEWLASLDEVGRMLNAYARSILPPAS